MKKLKIISVCLMSIMLVGCGTSHKNNNNVEQKQEEMQEIKVNKVNPINIEYEDNSYLTVFDEFKKQEGKAQEKYINKTLKITGEVVDIEKQNENIIVTIVSDNNFHTAILNFKDGEENEMKIGNLKEADEISGALEEGKGDVITVYGIFDEFAKIQGGSNYINLVNCEF